MSVRELVREFAEAAKHRREMVLLSKMQDARERGDWDEYFRLLPGMPMTPEWLKTMKRLYGADTIRAMRIDTSPADERYGHGWLDSPGPGPVFEWHSEALSRLGSPG